MNDDPFRDWLVRRIEYLDYLIAGSGGTMEQHISARVTRGILNHYDAEMAAAATDDAGTENHADTPDTPCPGDPDDQAAYDAAMAEYRTQVRLLVSLRGALWKETVEAINALPKPVQGGGG